MHDPTAMFAALREELEALEIWAEAPDLPEDVADGIQISIDKIRRVLGQAPQKNNERSANE